MMSPGFGGGYSNLRMVQPQELFYTGVGGNAGARPETNFMEV